MCVGGTVSPLLGLNTSTCGQLWLQHPLQQVNGHPSKCWPWPKLLNIIDFTRTDVSIQLCIAVVSIFSVLNFQAIDLRKNFLQYVYIYTVNFFFLNLRNLRGGQDTGVHETVESELKTLQVFCCSYSGKILL